MDQSRHEFDKMRSEAIRLVKGAFDRAGIVMPEPIYNVRLGRTSAALSGAGAAAQPSSPRPEPAAAPASPEPAQAIDIAARDELDDQIAAERSSGEENLLTRRAPEGMKRPSPTGDIGRQQNRRGEILVPGKC